MNNKFPNLKLEQIKFFDELLQQTSTNELRWIKNKYQNKYNNFQQIYSILSNSKLISKEDKKILLANSVNKISPEMFLINLIKYTNFSKHIRNYLEAYDILDDKIFYNPTLSENIKYSNIRNFLIEAGYIKYNGSSKIYYFLSKRYDQLKNIFIESDSAISPKLLKIIQDKQEQIGNNAELAVLNYERKKLFDYPNLQKSLIHVAKYDTSAGYDIKSWDVDTQDYLEPRECYIEVKAVSVDEIKFYWTRNEIKKAKEYGGKYYLYLLPVISDSHFNINKLKKISDPYVKIYLNKEWNRQVENYLFQSN